MKRLIPFIVLLLSFNLQAEQDRGLIWRIQSATATVTLLGSIHYADASFYPLRKEIEQAFNQADKLVVEVNMDAAAIDQARQIIQEKGSYQGSDTLRNHLSTDTYKNLLKLLAQLEIPYSLVEQQKPGVVMMTLASVQLMTLGLSPELGIDAYFLHRAKTQNKTILELETVAQQLDMLINISDGDLLLQETLTSFEQMGDTMDLLAVSWKQGDESRLNTLIFEDMLEQHPAYLGIYEELFFKRNIAMAKKIDEYLKTDGNYFVVVGAGHLTGNKSVVAILKKMAHKVVRF